MGLPALVLAQALVSLAPTIENVSLLPARTEYRVPSTEYLGGAAGHLLASEDEGPGLPYSVLGTRYSPSDTGRRAVSLSDGYYTRLDIHRYASYATLPLFLIEYLAGQKLLEKGSAAPLWAERVHKPAAYAVAAVFTVNTVTGLLNLAEASKVPQGKKRRWVHSVLMLAADAGFIYGVSVAPSTAKIDARIASGKVGGWTPHKISTVASMGVATVGYLLMYLDKGD
jgi:hypothetical protein